MLYRDDSTLFKGTLPGTPNGELKEYSRNIMRICLPGSLYSIREYTL